MSLLLDRQQPCARWLEEIAQLTVSAVLWSGSLLKIIPYGDAALSANGASWSPNLTWQYDLGDSDFLDFGGGSDPVLLTRADPAEMTNWLGIEYMDSANGYNQQVLPVWDQGLIDQYGIRERTVGTGARIHEPDQRHDFGAAAVAAQGLCPQQVQIQARLALLAARADGHRTAE